MGRHRKPKPLITCNHCKKQFEGKPEAKFCSNQCKSDSRKLTIVCRCRRCSKDFTPKKSVRTEFCSRACFYRMTRMRKFSKERMDRPVLTKECAACGGEFDAINKNQINCDRAECITKLRGAYSFLRSQLTSSDGTRTCRFCSTKFRYKQLHSADICNSPQCIDAQSKERIIKKREEKSAENHKRRAKKVGQRAGIVRRKEVFMRDGYRCQLCKRKTRPDYNVNHPLYPNLDHIIPLAKGGEHSMVNLQCLCRECNIIKGDKAMGDQLRMFV